MTSYDYYIWIRSVSDVLGALLPLIIVVALLLGALVGWRWWLRARHGDPKKIPQLENQLRELQGRVAQLEQRDTDSDK